MRRILALVLTLSFLISAAVTVHANVQLTHITDATVIQIVSNSAIRVQLDGARTALVRIHGVHPLVGVPNNNEHARAFLNNNVMGRTVRLTPPGGAPQMDGRFNVMIVVLDGVNIAERINGDTLPAIVDVLPPRPTVADLRFAGQLFVNRDGHFIPHYRGDGFDNEPLWFWHNDQFFRFNPFNTGRTLLYFRSNNHFYPFFPGVNTGFSGNLYYIDPATGNHVNYIPGVTNHTGRVYFWSGGSYQLYVPWFWGYTHFPWFNWGGSADPWQYGGANLGHWGGGIHNWQAWGHGEGQTPWYHWGASNSPWMHWGAFNNPWQWDSPAGNLPSLGNDFMWNWNIASSPWWNWNSNWLPDGSLAWGWGGVWNWDGSWNLGGVRQPWTFDGINLSGMGQWAGPPIQSRTWNEDAEEWVYSEVNNSWIWGESTHPWQWWSANNPWYWAGTNNPWMWEGASDPWRWDGASDPFAWNHETDHPFPWHTNSPGDFGLGNFSPFGADGTGPWDFANSRQPFTAANDPLLSQTGITSPWQMGLVNYPDLGFIWKPQLYFREEHRGSEPIFTPYFPGITRPGHDRPFDIYILQGTNFVRYNPRFEGPREWEYFRFEENALDLFHNFRTSQWEPHVGQLYYWDHTIGDFLPYLGRPIR